MYVEDKNFDHSNWSFSFSVVAFANSFWLFFFILLNVIRKFYISFFEQNMVKAKLHTAAINKCSRLVFIMIYHYSIKNIVGHLIKLQQLVVKDQLLMNVSWDKLPLSYDTQIHKRISICIFQYYPILNNSINSFLLFRTTMLCTATLKECVKRILKSNENRKKIQGKMNEQISNVDQSKMIGINIYICMYFIYHIPLLKTYCFIFFFWL